MDPDKVDCEDAVPFCDFTESYTYTVSLYWSFSWHIVSADYDNDPTNKAGFAKFDASNLKLWWSGSEFQTRDYYEGPVRWKICINETPNTC